MDFKDRLKQLRQWRQLSQEALGDLAGLGQSAVGNYEAGSRTPNLNTHLPKLAKALGVPVSELFTETEPSLIGSPSASHPMRMDPAMLLIANRETTALQGVEKNDSEARWAELFAVVYPKVLAVGGDLSKEEFLEISRSVGQQETGGRGSGRSTGKRSERGRVPFG